MVEGPSAAVAERLESRASAEARPLATPTARPIPALMPAQAAGGAERLVPVRFFSRHRHRILGLALVEFLIVAAAVYGSLVTRFAGTGGYPVTGGTIAQCAIFGLVTVVGFFALGLYHLAHRAGYAGVLARVMVALGCTQIALGALMYALPFLALPRGVHLFAALYGFAGVAAVRFLYLKLVDDELFKRRVFVWGAGARAASIANRLRRRSDRRGFKIVGYYNTPGEAPQVSHAFNGSAEPDLLQYLLRERIDEVVIAMDDRRSGFPEMLLRQCRLRGIRVQDIVSFLEREAGYVPVELASPSWLIFSEGFRCDVVRVAVKRAFDILIAGTVLVLSAPIAVLAAIAVWLEDRGPIFYRQVRTGQHGRPFEILKFRSMAVNAETAGKAVWASKNDARVTRVGAFLRRSRIDEIPQVLNVLRGDMSFVGPRPERPQFVEELASVIPYYPERHFVKPGITGWAQVRFPYGASLNDAREKLGYDLYYVKNHTLLFDIMVMLQTVEVILFRVGSR